MTRPIGFYIHPVELHVSLIDCRDLGGEIYRHRGGPSSTAMSDPATHRLQAAPASTAGSRRRPHGCLNYLLNGCATRLCDFSGSTLMLAVPAPPAAVLSRGKVRTAAWVRPRTVSAVLRPRTETSK
jgi:hypothetical protein